MSADRYIAVRIDGQLTVHAVGSDGDYPTLCGTDDLDPAIGLEQADLPKRPKITCSVCKGLILHARTYTKRDFSKRTT